MSSQGHHKMQSNGCGNKKVSPKNNNNNGQSDLELTDEIDLGDRFSSDIARLCMNERYSDVEFVVENQQLPAHRVILAARSEYFRALLYGGLSEAKQRHISLEVPLDAFKVLLRYIYSGNLSLSTLDEDAVIDVLGLANQYGFQDLETAISNYLRQYLALGNVCMILDASRLYNLDELSQICLVFMDRNATSLLQHDSFKTLSKESLEEVLRRDSFFAPEVQIFIAVWKWCRCNPTVDMKSVLSLVRLPLMTLEHLLQVVRPSGTLEPDKILDAIHERNTVKVLPYRAAVWPEENVATPKFLSGCIQGENREKLLDGDVTSYDMERGYTVHCITDSNDPGIVVKLGTMCMINHIRLLLWDRDCRAYSYIIEVSGNQEHWERVVDYSEYYCRSWQFLYFDTRPMRYIRIVGTQNTANRVFHVVALEALHTSKVPKLVDGFIAPITNVATIEMSAIVTDGVSRTRNALINGDYMHYDWDSGYTCHQLGSGEIVVRLGQPYYVGSMRLLLWDCDARTYSFYIETSTNRQEWQMVVDMRHEKASSWQNFQFAPRPVVFIRIVGTHNTANEIFHCVHLECPSQDKTYLKMLAEREQEKQRNRERESDCATTSSNSNSSSSGGGCGGVANTPKEKSSDNDNNASASTSKSSSSTTRSLSIPSAAMDALAISPAPSLPPDQSYLRNCPMRRMMLTRGKQQSQDQHNPVAGTTRSAPVTPPPPTTPTATPTQSPIDLPPSAQLQPQPQQQPLLGGSRNLPANEDNDKADNNDDNDGDGGDDGDDDEEAEVKGPSSVD